MREIKFRAWDDSVNKMWPVEAINFKTGVVLLVDGENNGWDKLDEIFLMQHTGLYDKNGKGIYESDVVVEYLRPVLPLTMAGKEIKFRAIVRWDKTHCRWALYGIGHLDQVGSSMGVQIHNDLEIIGNIYENPELLNA